MPRTELQIHVTNDMSSIDQATARVRDHLKSTSTGLDEEFLLEVTVAFEEALTNAVFHGNLEIPSNAREDRKAYEDLKKRRQAEPPYCDRRVTVRVETLENGVRFVVQDEGKGFDPGTVPDPLDPDNLSRSHGRGLLVIQSFMDEVQYNVEGNQITMAKYRPRKQGESD